LRPGQNVGARLAHGDVVGLAQRASAAGVKFAERIARGGLSQTSGLHLVSGLARGIDAAHNRASLASGTVSVLGRGHDHINYPPESCAAVSTSPAAGVALVSLSAGLAPSARHRLPPPQPAE